MFDETKNIQESSEISYVEGEEPSHQKIQITIDEFDEHFWLKKFSRALRDGDQDIRIRLQQKFSTIVIDLVHNHPLTVLAFGLQDQEYFVTETFRCFWNTAPWYQKYSLKSMSDVVLHLSISVNTVIIDTLRSFSSYPEAPSENHIMNRNDISKIRRNIILHYSCSNIVQNS